MSLKFFTPPCMAMILFVFFTSVRSRAEPLPPAIRMGAGYHSDLRRHSAGETQADLQAIFPMPLPAKVGILAPELSATRYTPSSTAHTEAGDPESEHDHTGSAIGSMTLGARFVPYFAEGGPRYDLAWRAHRPMTSQGPAPLGELTVRGFIPGDDLPIGLGLRRTDHTLSTFGLRTWHDRSRAHSILLVGHHISADSGLGMDLQWPEHAFIELRGGTGSWRLYAGYQHQWQPVAPTPHNNRATAQEWLWHETEGVLTGVRLVLSNALTMSLEAGWLRWQRTRMSDDLTPGASHRRSSGPGAWLRLESGLVTH